MIAPALARILQCYENSVWFKFIGGTPPLVEFLGRSNVEWASLRAQIAEMLNSESWRLAKKLQIGQNRFAPHDSFRKRLLDKLVQKPLERG